MLEFDRAKHEYRLDGVPIVNVTRITDTLAPYVGIPERVLARKAEIGEAVHFATELYDANDLDWDSLPDEIAGYVKGWARFIEDTGFVSVLTEARVWSTQLRYAGTLDRAGTFSRLKGIKPSERAIVDLKTTYKLMPSVGPQTAAYQRAAKESMSLDAARRFCVRLKPDGTYELTELRDPSDFAVFQSALNVHYWRERHGVKA